MGKAKNNNLLLVLLIVLLVLVLWLFVSQLDGFRKEQSFFDKIGVTDDMIEYQTPNPSNRKQCIIEGEEYHNFSRVKISKLGSVNESTEITYTCTVCGEKSVEQVDGLYIFVGIAAIYLWAILHGLLVYMNRKRSKVRFGVFSLILIILLEGLAFDYIVNNSVFTANTLLNWIITSITGVLAFVSITCVMSVFFDRQSNGGRSSFENVAFSSSLFSVLHLLALLFIPEFFTYKSFVMIGAYFIGIIISWIMSKKDLFWYYAFGIFALVSCIIISIKMLK